MFVGVGLAIAAVGIALAANTAWRVATIPAKLRAHREREGSSIPSLFENLKILEIVIGIAMFLVCLSLLMIVLLSAESFLTRRANSAARARPSSGRHPVSLVPGHWIE